MVARQILVGFHQNKKLTRYNLEVLCPIWQLTLDTCQPKLNYFFRWSREISRVSYGHRCHPDLPLTNEPEDANWVLDYILIMTDFVPCNTSYQTLCCCFFFFPNVRKEELVFLWRDSTWNQKQEDDELGSEYLRNTWFNNLKVNLSKIFTQRNFPLKLSKNEESLVAKITDGNLVIKWELTQLISI